ncbi:MAG: WYL domain-containing protein [Candidatus Tenebribacter davisii]|nr:WYL domain-containing protein [Candidatus Tenebribacter davisii]
MPKNKEALIRYRVINSCFINKRYVTINDLIVACEEILDKKPIGERTIRRDLRDMKHDRGLGFYAPIAYDHQERAYKYLDRDYSINNLPLNDDEMNALIFASALLEQFQGVELLEHIPGAIQKIANHLRIRRNLKDEEHEAFIDLEKAPETFGTEFINTLIQALKNKQVLTLTYRAFDKDRSYKHTIHPYLLKEYRNRWYIFGFNDYWQGLRLYALDRIEKLEINNSVPYRACEKPPKDYFRNLVGVTRFTGTEPEDIVLKFSEHQAPYILTQPLHESQQVIEHTDEHLIISLKVHSSPELEILLLGWHKEVEILEPKDFREQIKKMHREAFELYE